MKYINLNQAIVFLTIAFFVSCAETGEFGTGSSKKVVGIQPFGDISSREIDSVMSSIIEMYDFEVVILKNEALPKNSYTEIRYPRYRADTLVQWLSDHRPDSVDIIVGLTNKDISVTKYKDNTREIKEPTWQYCDFGIFGLGRVGGQACVVSSNRLHGNASTADFYKRLTRITCHEVGHVLGLHHCPKEGCLMNDANEKISTVDNSTGVLCEACWIKSH
jgi:archaemetzincin